MEDIKVETLNNGDEEEESKPECRGYGECLIKHCSTYTKSKELICKHDCQPIKCSKCESEDVKWFLLLRGGVCSNCKLPPPTLLPPTLLPSTLLPPTLPPPTPSITSSQSHNNYNTPYSFIFVTFVYMGMLTFTINSCLFVTTLQLYLITSYTNTSIF